MKAIRIILYYIFSLCCVIQAEETALYWSSSFNSYYRKSTLDALGESTQIAGLRNPIDATADEVSMYFTDGSSLYKLTYGETTAEKVLDFNDYSLNVNAIAVANGWLYVATSTRIYHTQLEIIDFKLVLENPDGYISDLVCDGSKLYWTDEEQGLYSVPIYGGTRKLIVASSGSPMALTYFGDTLYWVEDGSQQLRKVNKDGSGDTLLVDFVNAFGEDNYVPQSLSISDGLIWWSDPAVDAIYNCKLDGSEAEPVTLEVFSPSNVAWVFPNSESDVTDSPNAGYVVQKIPLLSIEAYNFYIESIGVESDTHLESEVNTPLGKADVFFYATNCSMQSNSLKLEVTNHNPGYGQCGVQFRFTEPVDLSTWDLLHLTQDYSGNTNPLSGIFLHLANAKILELIDASATPFSTNQTSYPIYLFEPSGDNYIYLPKQVKTIAFNYDIKGGETITISTMTLQTAGPAQVLDAVIQPGGSRDVIVSTTRAITTKETIRLEATYDLQKWFDKSGYIAGNGETISFEKYLGDAPFYRFQVHYKIDTD